MYICILECFHKHIHICDPHIYNVVLNTTCNLFCSTTGGCPYTGQVFDNCASPCGPLTCDNYTDVGVCITSCEARCDCPSEQVLDLGRRTCVTTEECTGIVALEFIHHLYAHVYIRNW